MMRLSEAHDTATASKSMLKYKPNLKDLQMADGSEQENSAEDEGDVEMGEMDASDSELEDDLHGR